MLLFQKFRNRSTEEEIIDDFSMSGEEVIRTFRTIEMVNTLLGGNKVLVSGVRKLVRQLGAGAQPIRIYDLGCGSGDGLRAIARWGSKNNIPLQLTGIDANKFIVDHAREKARSYPEIEFIQQDIFDDACTLEKADIVTFNLCLHHFTEEEQLSLLEKCRTEGVSAVLINDLHRHWLAYYCFALFCRLSGANEVAREDGLLSILKGFKKKELLALGRQASVLEPATQWKWAFRYEMLLKW